MLISSCCTITHDFTVTCVLRYLKGSLDHGIILKQGPVNVFTGYTDAHWTGCPFTQKSTTSIHFWVLILSHGVAKSNQIYHVQVPKQYVVL